VTGINIGGVVYSKSVGGIGVSLILPSVRVSKRGVGIMTDTVFEVSSLLGGQLVVIDAMLLGFGLCIEINRGESC
jgi:hypothetical protein